MIIIFTRETATCGGVSLAPRRSAAFGEPSVPIWETIAFDGVSVKKKIGATQAPQF